MATRPLGEQFEIRTGPQRATAVKPGGVHEYSAGDRPVLGPYQIDAMCDGDHGTPLIPWPNRLADSAYRFDRTDDEAALTQPSKHNAIHGFLRWRSWQALEYQTSRVVMGTGPQPLPGHPLPVDARAACEMGESGLIEIYTGNTLSTPPSPGVTRRAARPAAVKPHETSGGNARVTHTGSSGCATAVSASSRPIPLAAIRRSA